ncbi:unnamed protein product [Rhizophagus irregularis]|uniref:Uncharacterized protein n=1 Tax=Rhizophagus irregularis TaxID=588596 RepID=A0A915ZQG9_9GLOM|nr:unnamed protein product [Rhizophagus irregularis]CAB5383221.1 unnamed protein product [Rhizophagus irregularis]
MSSKNNYEQRTSYVQRFNLSNMSNMRTRRKPQKLCPDCKETNDCVKLLSNKVNKFILNNVPCELEYDLSKFTLENLQKLVNFAIPNHNNNNNNNDKDNNNSSSV